MGDSRSAPDITLGVAGSKGSLTAFASGADIPALLCAGALEGLGRQPDLFRDIQPLGFRGVDIPLRANNLGHYLPSVAIFGGRRGESVRDPNLSAPMVEWP